MRAAPKHSLGRPAGEVRRALLDAAQALVTDGAAPTVRELAEHSCVGLAAATNTVKNLVRYGHLHKVRERRVAYRNRPVAEYAPGGQAQRSMDFSGLTRVW